MALLGTLIDTFPGTIDAAKWTSFNTGLSTIAQSGGVVTATPGAGTGTVGYAGYDSVNSYDLTASNGYLQIPTMVNAAAGCQCYFKIVKDASNSIQYLYENGTIKPQKTVAGATSDITAGQAYNNTTHQWLRIRESGGTTFFDYSSDALTWNNMTSLANPFAITTVTVEFAAGTYLSVASPGFSTFDNFNILPNTGAFFAGMP